MLSVVSQRWRRITSACCRLRLRSWPCSDAASCLPARRSVAFLRPWTRRVWKRYVACSCRMRWLARDPRRAWEVCGIGEGNDGWSSIWTAPDRPHDSVRCLRVRICPLHSGGCKRSVRLATRGASGGKSCACLSRLRAHRPVNHVHNEGTSSLRSHDVGRCVEPGLQRNGTRSAGRATWGPIRRFRLPGPLGTPPRVCHPLAPVGGLLTSSVPYLRGFSSEARWSYK